MGTTINAPTLLTGRSHGPVSALRLAVQAGGRCLERAGRSPGDLDLLLNVGLYHDRNLGEPALAALIQEDLGANPEDPRGTGHGTFSFDIANGPCGVLTALQVADGFLAAGTITDALVVAGDANPGHRLAPAFPYSAAGSATLCRWTDGDAGLKEFRWCNDPDGGESFRSTVELVHGRNVLTIEESGGFAERAAAAAAKAGHEVLAAQQLRSDDVDLVVANLTQPGFVRSLCLDLGVSPERVVTPPSVYALHTAGLIGALETAFFDAPFAAAGTVLLVCAGAGITAGAALYRPATSGD
jgi:3-oxoacyl-[acyl-carrier-protein] synthase-3